MEGWVDGRPDGVASRWSNCQRARLADATLAARVNAWRAKINAINSFFFGTISVNIAGEENVSKTYSD